MHFGIISPPVSGHIHPFGALGRELIRRGHRVTFIHMADLCSKAQSEGLEFLTVGESDHPQGSLPESLAALARLSGLSALRFTISAIKKTTEMFCRDAPDAIAKAGIQALLVDQTEPAGGTIAEHLGLPFVTVCCALALNREACVPPPFTGWDYSAQPWARVRNGIGYSVYGKVMRPVTQVLSRYRRRWNLRPHRDPEQSFSTLAQISQQPAAFDFPRQRLASNFHYVGPLRDAQNSHVPFPWDRLSGKPLVYASLGTLQNRKEEVFRCFAQACEGLPVQLVITHGNGLDERAIASMPGRPIVVGYAPQLEVLARAQLTLTHAGLNTVLDSLTHGVPLVAVPITYEQPAIASRIRWTGVGEVVSLSGLDPGKLRKTISRVLDSSTYSDRAQTVKKSIAQAGGVARAAGILEAVL